MVMSLPRMLLKYKSISKRLNQPFTESNDTLNSVEYEKPVSIESGIFKFHFHLRSSICRVLEKLFGSSRRNQRADLYSSRPLMWERQQTSYRLHVVLASE